MRNGMLEHMDKNKANKQVVRDFIIEILGNETKELADFRMATLEGNEWPYKNLGNLVKSAVRRNHEDVQNIVLYHGSGSQACQDHSGNMPFGFSKFIKVDCDDMSYFTLGIRYRDIPGSATEDARQKALQLANSLSLKPTAIVDSGVSIQLYWKLDRSYPLSREYDSGDKIRFAGSALFCSQYEALWSVINTLAHEIGLTLEYSATTISWRDGQGVCDVNMYSLLPGCVYYYLNEQLRLEEFMVEVIELNERRYRYEDIMDWLNDWNKENLQVLASAETLEELRELCVREYIENRISHNTMIDLLPRAWQIPYVRIGNEVSQYTEEALEWVRQENAGDIEDDIESDEWVLEIELKEAQ